MNNKTIFDHFMMSIAMPEGIRVGAEISPPLNDSIPSDEPANMVNTLQ